MSCRHVRDWLHRDAASLDEAQRLQLDDHLASCETCRGDRVRMQTLRRVGTSLDAPSADSRMFDRAIARALLEGPRTPARVEPARGRWMWMVAFGALAATALAAVVALRGTNDEPGSTSKGEHASKGNGPSNSDHASKNDGPSNSDHASKSEDDIAPAPVREALKVVIGASVTGTTSIERDDLTVTNDRAPSGPTNTRVSPAESIAAVLARARTQLAAKQHAEAERTANSVLARADATLADEAEARTILADVAQARGQLELAKTRYLEVAAKFESLSAGESALYAAARVEARRGGDARALLERYLARYPRGRFVNDARRLLGAEENR